MVEPIKNLDPKALEDLIKKYGNDSRKIEDAIYQLGYEDGWNLGLERLLELQREYQIVLNELNEMKIGVSQVIEEILSKASKAE